MPALAVTQSASAPRARGRSATATGAARGSSRGGAVGWIGATAEAQQLAQRIRAARQQAAQGSEQATRLAALEAQVVTAPIRYSQPMLIDQLNYLYGLVTGADQKLGRDAIARYDELKRELDAHTAAFRGMGSGN